MLTIRIFQTCLRLASAHIQSMKAQNLWACLITRSVLCIKWYVLYIMHNLSRVDVELSLYAH